MKRPSQTQLHLEVGTSSSLSDHSENKSLIHNNNNDNNIVEKEKKNGRATGMS